MNPEAERAILGAVLLDKSTLDSLPADLVPADFQQPHNRLIYQAMLDLAGKGQPIDLLTVAAAIPGGVQTVGGVSYLAGLDLDLPDISRVGIYGEVVRREGVRARAIEYLSSALRGLKEARDPLAAIDALVGEMEALAVQRVATEDYSAAKGVDRFLEETERRTGNEGKRVGLLYGHGVDTMTGGLGFGRLHILAGDYGVGKTAQAVQALDLAVLAGHRIGFLSLEMPEHDIYVRWAARRMGLDTRKIEAGRLGGPEWTQLFRVAKELKRAQAWVISRAGSPWSALKREVRSLSRQEGVKMWMLDHYHIDGLSPASKEGETVRINALTESMRDLALAEGLAFLALGQVNRGAKAERPTQSSLRYAGAGPAHTVSVIWQLADGTHEMVVVKNRTGPRGPRALNYDGATSTWRDAEG